jgi:hypothetical protein
MVGLEVKYFVVIVIFVISSQLNSCLKDFMSYFELFASILSRSPLP